MNRLITGVSLALLNSLAYALDAAEAPVEHASGGVVVTFLVLFVAFCVGVGWLMWKNDKNEKLPAK